MQALQLFKTAGVWDDIKGYLDNDYVKYPAIGAGIGGAAMGAASALGGPGEGVEEKPNEKRNRILGSAAKGMGFGGAAGLGAAGLKDWFNGDSGNSPENPGVDGPEKMENARKTYSSNQLSGLQYGGAALGGLGGFTTAASRQIANADKATDAFNAKGNGIVDDIKGQMAGGGSREAIDALKKAYKATGDPDIKDQIDKLKGTALDDLLGRLHAVPTEHAPVAVGAAAKALQHAIGHNAMPHELDQGLDRMVGTGDTDQHAGFLKKYISQKAPGASGMDNLAAQTKNYANNGFTDKPHLDLIQRSGRRVGYGALGAALGYLAPTAISGAATSLFGSSKPYTAPHHANSPEIK